MTIDFDMNSRGANIQSFSQYPHEAELCAASSSRLCCDRASRVCRAGNAHTRPAHRLFPPCTGLSCRDVYEHGTKRCLLVSAQVSTARLDTKELTTPDAVPGTADAVRWASELLGCGADELAGREVWDLASKNLSAREHQEKLALLIGRAAANAAPRLTTLNLGSTQLGAGGAVLLAEGLKVNGSLTKVRSAPSPTRGHLT